MGLLDDYSALNGHGSPRPAAEHQKIITWFTGKFNFEHPKVPHLFYAVGEYAVSKRPEKAPDIVILNEKTGSAVSFIEITKKPELNGILTETEQLLKKLGFAEAHVYDYKTHTWYKFTNSAKIKNARIDEPAWSDLFQCDYNEYVNY